MKGEYTDDQLRRKALGDLWKAAELAHMLPDDFHDTCYPPKQIRWKGKTWDRMVMDAVAKYRAAHQ